MSYLDRLVSVRVGTHTDRNYSTFPSIDAVDMQVIGGVDTLHPPQRTPISRNDGVTEDGQGFAHLRGALDMAEKTITTELPSIFPESLDDVETIDNAINSYHRLLSSNLTPQNSPTVGAMPSSVTSGSNPATGTLVVAANTIVNGDMILFSTAAGWQARQVVSGGGTTTLTLCRPWVGAVNNAVQVHRAARWALDMGRAVYPHLALSVSRKSELTRWLGLAAAGFSLTGDVGSRLAAAWRFLPSDAAVLSPSATTYAAPDSGDPIVNLNSQCWIGSKQLLMYGFSFTHDNGLSPRDTSSSPNGRSGGVAIDSRQSTALEFQCDYGTNSPEAGELARSGGAFNLETLLGYDEGNALTATHDVLVTIGAFKGRTMALRIPRADIQGTLSVVDGKVRASVRCAPTSPAAAALTLGLV